MALGFPRALALLGLSCLYVTTGCGDPSAPAREPPSLTIEGVVRDSTGNAIPGALLTAWQNSFDSSFVHGTVLEDLMTDSMGHYRVHFDSLLEPLDSVTVRLSPPGCDFGSQLQVLRDITVPTHGPLVIPQDIVAAHPQPRATGTIGRVCGMVSDEGLFGYSGWAQLLIETSVEAPAGDHLLAGRWTITWFPTYGGSDGTFAGTETDSFVTLALQDTTGAPGCPEVEWRAPVDASGSWGIFVPSVAGGAPCRWASFPVMLVRDTASGPWP